MNIHLFTDGSVHPKSKTGYGAYLALKSLDTPFDEARKFIASKRFENTSSTRLELQTLLWALEELSDSTEQLTIYTDSQNTATLPERRERLEAIEYCSKSGKPLNNADLYRQFFETIEAIDYEIVKVTGHSPNKEKDTIAKFFTLVDRTTREELRRH